MLGLPLHNTRPVGDSQSTHLVAPPCRFHTCFTTFAFRLIVFDTKRFRIASQLRELPSSPNPPLLTGPLGDSLINLFIFSEVCLPPHHYRVFPFSITSSSFLPFYPFVFATQRPLPGGFGPQKMLFLFFPHIRKEYPLVDSPLPSVMLVFSELFPFFPPFGVSQSSLRIPPSA